MSKILYWNCRGACDGSLLRNLRLAWRNSCPDLLILTETKSENASLVSRLEPLGFDASAFIPSVGRSGGLCAVWRSEKISVVVLKSNRQYLHFKCSLLGHPVFLLTAVYAVPIPHLKQALWADLRSLAAIISLPWVVVGDFNDIASMDERIGGSSPNVSRMKIFQDRIQDCMLSDLGSSGPRFTWKGPKLPNCPRLFQRLDRALANNLFLMNFGNCYIQVLARTKFSDHSPLMVCLGNESSVYPVLKPFRFEAMWLEHEFFESFLAEKWLSGECIDLALLKFQLELIPWNRNVFGYLEKEKSIVLARLKGIQSSSSYPYSHFLCDLEKQLQEKLDYLIKLDEIKWFQKSKVKWINDGDRNTRFYHLSSKMKCRRNRIVALKNGTGGWIDSEEELKSLVVDFFKGLFTDDTGSSAAIVSNSSFPRLDESSLKNLDKIPTDEEIRTAIFSMGNFKAPGNDGFPPVFYKKNWSRVGSEVCAFVKGVFNGSSSLVDANKTLISLIPKRESPELISHFRPISLCTVHYKGVTKIITQRLKGVLNDLISPYQASFIKGRHIQDNLLVGQELLHIMHKNRSKQGLMAIKIDLEKAYDRIRWDFLRLVLLEVGFEESFIDLVMTCVSSVSYNVLWNGSKTEFFTPGRGLRQGDPMSPLLFVLCMDKISHLICDEVESGNWQPIATSRTGPKISHLMFADDLLLFGAATIEQAKCMLACLDKFTDASGGMVNRAKSSLFFSPRVSAVTKNSIRVLSQMTISCDIGRYLGFPLSRSRNSRETFHYVIERVQSKLSVWKARSLSMAGRVTLAKSVISSIPLYPMQVARLPKGVCLAVEKIQRNFIWGHGDNNNRFHPVGWDRITRPKEFGGLGFRRLQSLNKACGAKLAWNLVTGATGLWAEVLQAKYMLRDEHSLLVSKSGDSKLWKFITSQRHIIEKGTKWQIRNGSMVRFFEDRWLFDGKISDQCLRILSDEESRSSVADWVLNGFWDMDRLAGIVNTSILQRLISHLPPVSSAGYDVMTWGASGNGIFSIRSAYFLIENNPLNLKCNLFKHIWKWNGMERIRVFLWRVVLNSLPTNGWRSSWSSASPLCGYCNQALEDSLHVLRDCIYAKRLWLKLIPRRYVHQFFSSQMEDWLSMNFTGKFCTDLGNDWALIFGVSIWKLWSWRNAAIFDSSFSKPRDPHSVILHSWRRYTGFRISPTSCFLSSTIPDVVQCWQPPHEGWVKLNVDGAMVPSTSKAGCGGVLRDYRGEWIAGFSKELGMCNARSAEEWAVLEGLMLASDLGFRQVVVESDALELVNCLNDPHFVSGSLVVQRTKVMVSKDWVVSICYIPREFNQVADALAKWGLSRSCMFSECPSSLRALADKDDLGFLPLSM
ncbi:hypothetical protein QN277_004963 [Acacia crassicarpa]|uniref:Reverse transcriptase domain-containing protein n=1 Tax=Acacia crassicarpa TaxID=499986 RepID=A0AAE1MFW4_9FABA|nr:hypothetical protein QN277_004963 [Acacia crassicarpa]